MSILLSAMRSKIFLLLMLFSPGILGIPTDDVLQANESSVDIGLSKGVSKENNILIYMHMQLRTLHAIIIKQQVITYNLSVKLYTAKIFIKSDGHTVMNFKMKSFSYKICC